MEVRMEVRMKVRIDGGDDAGATRHGDDDGWAWQRQAGAEARRRCGDNGQER